MGLFDFFEDAKESVDKSRQAREYIQRAKELVREADDIYEKAYSKTMSYASETEYQLHKHMDYKKSIANELGGEIGTILKSFRDFDIELKIVSPPSIQETNTGIREFKRAVSNFMPHDEIPSIFDIFISDSDYYEARRQRDEAKRYKDRMKMEREKLNGYKEKMREIQIFIDCEKKQLNSLMSKLKKITDELEKGMKKSELSVEEAECLKGIQRIAESIVTLLSTEFLEDTFSINEKYRTIFESVKNINENLPDSLSVKDAETTVVMKRILDDIIVY